MRETITLKDAHNYMLNELGMDMGLVTDILIDDRLKILPEQFCGKVCVHKDNLEEVIKTKKMIKFNTKNRSKDNFSTTLRKNILNYFKENDLSTTANMGMIFKTIVMISIYVVPFILLVTLNPNMWVSIGLVILMGLGIAGTGMCVMHDAVHGAYSKKKWVNKILGGTLYLLGCNTLNWKIQHNILHHTYTNISEHDEDVNTKGPIRLHKDVPLKKIHKYQYVHAFFFYGLMTLSKMYNDFPQLIKYNKMGLTKKQKVKPKQELIKMIIRKIAYLSIVIGLPLIVSEYNILEVIIGFLLMHWVAGFILSVIFQLAHVVEGAQQTTPPEDGNMENEFAVHQLLTTSDFGRDSKLLSWLVGGLNFQIEHHLFPHICHIHYKKLSYIVEETAKQYNLPYNTKKTFFSALNSHIKQLKILGNT